MASRTSAFFFKGKPADVHEIGAKLHVGFVVEGSVRKQGDQLKVTAQLIRTDDGYHVWSGSFERQLSDVFKVQQELAGSLVTALQVKLTGAQTRRLKKTHTANQQAFDLYLQGKHVLNSFAPDSLDRAERLFQQSIAADPAYALSYVALADVYVQANIYGNRPARELASKASAAIHKALALDDELAEAYVMLGTLAARHEYDWAAAERHLRHALELNPSSAHGSLRARPECPGAPGTLAGSLGGKPPGQRTGPALPDDRHERALAGGSGEAPRSGGRGISQAGGGQFPGYHGVEADWALRSPEREIIRPPWKHSSRCNAWQPSSQTLAFIGYVQARDGESRRGAEDSPAIAGRVASGSSFHRQSCLLYMGLGDADKAFRYLEMAREQQESSLIFARVQGSVWDPFRNDPRYLTLLTEIGLSDEQIQKNQYRH